MHSLRHGGSRGSGQSPVALTIRGRPLMAGAAHGRILASTEPLSFWGGYDAETGEIIDRRHPLSGQLANEAILAVPSTRGSSTTTAVLLEAIRAGTAPAALLTSGVDSFLALAAIVAEEMYGRTLPIVALAGQDHARLRTGDSAEIHASGKILIREV